MDKSRDQPYINLRERTPPIHSWLQFVDALRIGVTNLTVEEKDYEHFEHTSVEIMTEVLQVFERILNEHSRADGSVSDEVIKQVVFARDAVQDGFADLVACKHESMPYDDFLVELEEWQARWRTQIHLR